MLDSNYDHRDEQTLASVYRMCQNYLQHSNPQYLMLHDKYRELGADNESRLNELKMMSQTNYYNEISKPDSNTFANNMKSNFQSRNAHCQRGMYCFFNDLLLKINYNKVNLCIDDHIIIYVHQMRM